MNPLSAFLIAGAIVFLALCIDRGLVALANALRESNKGKR